MLLINVLHCSNLFVYVGQFSWEPTPTQGFWSIWQVSCGPRIFTYIYIYIHHIVMWCMFLEWNAGCGIQPKGNSTSQISSFHHWWREALTDRWSSFATTWTPFWVIPKKITGRCTCFRVLDSFCYLASVNDSGPIRLIRTPLAFRRNPFLLWETFSQTIGLKYLHIYHYCIYPYIG